MGEQTACSRMNSRDGKTAGCSCAVGPPSRSGRETLHRPAGRCQRKSSILRGLRALFAGPGRRMASTKTNAPWLLCALGLVLSAGGCGGAGKGSMPASSDSDTRPYLLETVGEYAVSRVYADGFEELSKNDRALAFYLYRAALAGRDIFYDQMGRDVLEIRDLLEEILIHPQGID